MTTSILDEIDGVYTQSMMIPCLGYVTNSGHMWHLSPDCPEVARIAHLTKEDLRHLYEQFRSEAPRLSQRDAGILRMLFSAAGLVAWREGLEQSQRILNLMAEWCRDRHFGQIGPHIPHSTGSTGGDWFDERG